MVKTTQIIKPSLDNFSNKFTAGEIAKWAYLEVKNNPIYLISIFGNDNYRAILERFEKPRTMLNIPGSSDLLLLLSTLRLEQWVEHYPQKPKIPIGLGILDWKDVFWLTCHEVFRLLPYIGRYPSAKNRPNIKRGSVVKVRNYLSRKVKEYKVLDLTWDTDIENWVIRFELLPSGKVSGYAAPPHWDSQDQQIWELLSW